jgi:hypothetical protein
MLLNKFANVHIMKSNKNSVRWTNGSPEIGGNKYLPEVLAIANDTAISPLRGNNEYITTTCRIKMTQNESLFRCIL